jgi:hypothetical protein
MDNQTSNTRTRPIPSDVVVSRPWVKQVLISLVLGLVAIFVTLAIFKQIRPEPQPNGLNDVEVLKKQIDLQTNQIKLFEQHLKNQQEIIEKLTHSPNIGGQEPVDPHPGMKIISYVVRPRDTLSIIAKAYHIDLKDILKANPELASSPDKIEIGQQINIPVYEEKFERK